MNTYIKTAVLSVLIICTLSFAVPKTAEALSFGDISRGFSSFTKSVSSFVTQTVTSIKNVFTSPHPTSCALTYGYTGTGTGTCGGYSGTVSAPIVITVAAGYTTASSPYDAMLMSTLASTGGAAMTSVGVRYGTTAAYGTIAPDGALWAAGNFYTYLSGLSCATTYHYQAYASNTAGITYGADASITTAPCPVTLPVVTTVSASSVTPTTAVFNGMLVNTGGAAVTNTGFVYGTAGLTAVAGSFSTPGSFSTTVSGLTCHTTYEFHAYATNSAGSAGGATLSFTTAACPTLPPVVSTVPPTSAATTGMILNGSLNSVGSAPSATVGFEWGTTTGYGTVTLAAIPPMTAAGLYTANISGLVCGTMYHYRALATSMFGSSHGTDMTFTTIPCVAPSLLVSTNTPSGVAATSATFNGTLASAAGSTSTTVGFEYGLTASYGSVASIAAPMAATGTFYKNMAGLTCGTTYHYRATATNSAASGHGADTSFTTSACPLLPLGVTTVSAVGFPPSGTTLNGTLTGTGGASTTNVGFEIGTTTSYGIPVPASPKAAAGAFAASVGLDCSKTYHYRAYANNSIGSVHGADLVFVTPACSRTTTPTRDTSVPTQGVLDVTPTPISPVPAPIQNPAATQQNTVAPVNNSLNTNTNTRTPAPVKTNQLNSTQLMLGANALGAFSESSVLSRTLRFDMTGSDVATLQQYLKQLGFFSGTVTGYYGLSTVSSVKAFQMANSLETVGSAGPSTIALLNKLLQ